MLTVENFALDSYRVADAIPEIYYIKDFLTKEEEQFYMHFIEDAPKPKWKVLKDRRLQNWGGHPHAKGLVKEGLPDWLEGICEKLGSYRLYPDGRAPNHVLINEYKRGQGILPHEDGPIFSPTICTISLGSSTVIEYVRKSASMDGHVVGTKDWCALLLEPRSLVIVMGEAYTTCLHGIRPLERDQMDSRISNLSMTDAKSGDVLERKTRISMTIRHAPKTLAGVSALLKK
eukprot:Clim_evm102s88 gene=Clim_evmTU102s88